MRLLALLVAGCGGGYAPVVVSIQNDGPRDFVPGFRASLAASLKVSSGCQADCELRGGLPDGGALWFGVDLVGLDAGERSTGVPQQVEARARVNLELQRGGSVADQSCKTFFEVPAEGTHVTATRYIDGGREQCAFAYAKP